MFGSIYCKTQSMQNIRGCCSVRSQPCVRKKFRHKNATHVITKQYHNYLTLLKTKDAQNGVVDFSL